MYDYMLIDVGSTYTKVRLISGHKLVASAQSPTTLDDVNIAISDAKQQIETQVGAVEAAQMLASSSAAGGLRMVAMGYMARVTAKAAKEVAMNSGAKILEILSSEDPAAYRLQVLKEIQPDIVLLAGGTDYGDASSLIENAGVIAQSGVSALVVIAGNVEAQPCAASVLRAAGVAYVRIPNIMPTIHELRVDRARSTIHREFIQQITKAPGLSSLKDSISGENVLPTPGAVLLAAELLAKGTRLQEGIGDLIVLDLGGATTDVHSVVPSYAKMSKEEIGLIVTNARQVSYRTVEGNLGMRVSAAGVTAAVDPRDILARQGIVDEQMAERLSIYCEQLEQQPDALPQTDEEYDFDTWIAQTAIELAVKRHAGYFVTEPDPVTGLSPGMPVGRDLRDVHKVIAVGGIFAHRSEAEGRVIVQAAFRNRGISLLPAYVEVAIDQAYLFYTGGVIGMQDEEYALTLLKNFF